MPVTCAGCGRSWPRDPAIEVACPKCLAPAGSRCKRPSGHECDVHVERDGLALAQGVMRAVSRRPRQTDGEPIPTVPADDALRGARPAPVCRRRGAARAALTRAGTRRRAAAGRRLAAGGRPARRVPARNPAGHFVCAGRSHIGRGQKIDGRPQKPLQMLHFSKSGARQLIEREPCAVRVFCVETKPGSRKPCAIAVRGAGAADAVSQVWIQTCMAGALAGAYPRRPAESPASVPLLFVLQQHLDPLLCDLLRIHG